MRIRIIAGILLFAAGAFILIRGWSYTSRREVLRLGDFKASVEEKHPIPPWVGGAAIAGGMLLIFVGRGRRKTP